MKKIITALICVLFINALNAQVKGIVFGSSNLSKSALYGARVKLLNADRGVITDEDGKFELILPKELPDTMVFSAMGYYSDTIIVDKQDRFISFEVILYSEQILPEVVASYKKGTHSISRLKTLHVEEIGEGELRKAACCNLSESFETNASVDVNITDAVSGAKQIQMMGLAGIYTQIQMENIPYLRGLESAFGLNSIPGTWISSIQITKGTGTVVNGYESMAGLVNLEIKKPQAMERFYLNAYGSIMGRFEVNMNSGFKLGKKWSTGILVHGSTQQGEMDRNKDGFRDVPMGYNFALMNRYHYQGKKMEAQIGFNAYLDNKDGGQVKSIRNNTAAFYGVNIDSKHIDLSAKTGFFMKKPGHSIGIVYNVKYQTLDAKFGLRSFKGEEKRGYINAIYDGIIKTSDHKFKVGMSGVYANFKQQMDSLNDDREEIVPGVFGEYSYTGSRLSAVIGARGDYHNLYNFQFSPRLHLKYILTERTDLRFTVGRGWRVPNYMIDNISLLATSQTWVAPTSVSPEVSWNIGGSLVQEFKLFGNESTITVDYYYTHFENQMIVDRDETINAIVFKNLSGRSFSHSLQGEFSFSPAKQIDVRIAYKYLDVKANYGGELRQKVMVPNHRGFINVGYKTRNKRWEFDVTASVFGESRLPQVMLADSSFSTDNKSNVYPMVNAQITHVYKRWDFYIGGENLTNYTQKNPIIDAENPFNPTFNATRIWAPIIGLNVYAGVRFSIKQKEEKETVQTEMDGHDH